MLVFLSQFLTVSLTDWRPMVHGLIKRVTWKSDDVLSRNIGRFSGTGSKLKFSFLSRVARAKSTRAMSCNTNTRFQSGNGRLWRTVVFQFLRIFRLLFDSASAPSRDGRPSGLVACETVSVTDSLRPPDRFAPNILCSKYRARQKRRKKLHALISFKQLLICACADRSSSRFCPTNVQVTRA